MYKLRDYQQSQKGFLDRHKGDLIGPNSLFDTNIALESPTGSGKSIVILTFIKELFEQNKGMKIFISTGFNNLVFQMAETAKEMGIPTEILIGKSNANCVKKINASLDEEDKFITYNKYGRIASESIYPELNVFDQHDKRFRCKYNECSNCRERFTDNCIYNSLVNKIANTNNNILVITNHLAYLHNRCSVFKDFEGGFIDECQTFADFYESFISVEVTPSQFNTILKDVEENQIEIGRNDLLIKLIRSGLKNGQLSKKMLGDLLDIKLKGKDKNGSQLTVETKHKNISENIREWILTESDYDNYIYPLFYEDRFQGIKIDKFFDKIYFGEGSICLISATVDNYTKNLFRITEEYKEESCKLFDYTKSNFYIYPTFEFKYLKDFIKNQEGDRGIILSTRLTIVEQAKEQKEICGYEFIFSADDFVNGKKQILVGSKSMFQGIDLPSVDFVMINKIPFPRYNESYKKKMSYLDGFTRLNNSFVNYTIPYTENQLIQAMGRLWRKPGDVGNVAVFDSKLINKHNKILKSVSHYRYGINIRNKVYFD